MQEGRIRGRGLALFPGHHARRRRSSARTTADERGNLSYEHEGAYLGRLDQALAVRNNGGIVIAQVKRVTKSGSLSPHDVLVPGMLVDCIVVAPDQKQTDADPLRPRHLRRGLPARCRAFRVPEFNVSEGDRPPRRAGAALRPAAPSISASASRPTCPASCSRKACTATSPG